MVKHSGKTLFINLMAKHTSWLNLMVKYSDQI
jgi:hypothetical protein